MDTYKILEVLKCSQYNFDNLIKMNPKIADHSMYKIARMQLDDAVVDLEKYDNEILANRGTYKQL